MRDDRDDDQIFRCSEQRDIQGIRQAILIVSVLVAKAKLVVGSKAILAALSPKDLQQVGLLGL